MPLGRSRFCDLINASSMASGSARCGLNCLVLADDERVASDRAGEAGADTLPGRRTAAARCSRTFGNSALGSPISFETSDPMRRDTGYERAGKLAESA